MALPPPFQDSPSPPPTTPGQSSASDPSHLNLARWVAGMVGALLMILAVSWLIGSGRPLLDDGPTARLGGDSRERTHSTVRLRDAMPPAGADAAPARIKPPVAPPPNPGPFAFLSEDESGPVTYSPCRALEVVVNTDSAPPGAYEAVEWAVSQISAASGLSLRVAGRTDEQHSDERQPYQPDRYGERWAPILVDWTPEREVPEFAGNAVGLGGSLGVAAPGGRLSYVTGEVTLSSTYFAVPTTAQLLREVLLHEFGHVLGLAHVNDEAQIMTSTAVGGRPLGSGDLAGLARLGSGPCTPKL